MSNKEINRIFDRFLALANGNFSIVEQAIHDVASSGRSLPQRGIENRILQLLEEKKAAQLY